MRVLELEVQDFRNQVHARLELAPGVNLVVGPNGVGKTNLLEALAVVATGRSPRTRSAEVLVRRGAPRARLRALFEDSTGTRHEIVVLLEARGGKRMRIDGKAARKLSELMGRLPVVQLFPEDLGMATGAPSLRRSWLDALCAAAVPGYVRLRQSFERVLRQRNAVLKARRSARELEAHDPPYLDRAARVHAARARTLERLRERLTSIRPLFEAEAPSLEYWARGLSEEEIRGRLAGRLEATRASERRLYSTQAGPHRDDFKLRVGERLAQEEASRGQLRTLFLQLKLAEAELVREASGKLPVLILDDALSDMDAARRLRTLEHLAGRGQVLLSIPEAPGPPPEGGALLEVAPPAA